MPRRVGRRPRRRKGRLGSTEDINSDIEIVKADEGIALVALMDSVEQEQEDEEDSGKITSNDDLDAMAEDDPDSTTSDTCTAKEQE